MSVPLVFFAADNPNTAASADSNKEAVVPADGSYTINALLLKAGTTTASMAQTYFDKQADLTVTNGKYSLTLHLTKNKKMISDVSVLVGDDSKAAVVTSTGDQSEDLTFAINNLTDVTTLSMTIHPIPTMNMVQKVDVQPALDSLTPVQANEDVTNSSNTKDSSATAASSASSVESATSTDTNTTATTEQTNTDGTTSSTTDTSNNNNEETDPVVTLPTNPITNTNPATTPSTTDESDTSLTQSPLFDPANLSDGTYQVPVSILKTGTQTASLAASYFSDNATVVVSDNATKITVTLHVIKNASLITAFAIGDNQAAISNQTTTSEDLTFNVASQFSNSIVTASMSITIPVLNTVMNESADLSFASALYVKPTQTGSSDNPTTPVNGDDNKTGTSTASDFDSAKLADGSYEVPMTVLKSDSDDPSVSAGFFAPTATVKVSDNATKVTVTLHITKNASTITAFSLVGQDAVVSNQTKDSEDLTFTVDKNFNNAIVTAGMTITIPVLNTKMNQTARVKFATTLYSEQPNTPPTDNRGTTNTGNTTGQPGTTTDNNSSDEPTTADLPTFDPNNLNDGQYKIDATILKSDNDTVSASASFFDPYATVTVSNNTKKIEVTLHVTANASTIEQFALTGKTATVSNKTASSEDLTFTVDNTFKDATVPATMTIKIPVLNTEMNETARVKFGAALYVASATDNSDSGTTTGQPGTPAGEGSSTDTPTTPEDTSGTDTTTTNLPTFDPNNLKDGQYKIATTILKADSNAASVSASFFDPYATVTVSNNTSKIEVTLHVVKNASTIEQFTLAGQPATVTNETSNGEDLTSTVDNTFKDAIMPATMTIKIPVLNTEMNETARVKFGAALYAHTTQTSGGESGTGTTVNQPDPNSGKPQVTNFDPKDPKDGTYSIQAPIMKADDLTQSSAAQKFISKQATVVVSNNGTKIQLLLHLTSGAEYIKSMIIAGQKGTITNKQGDTADLIFNISPTTLLGVGKTEFSLVTPVGSMNESAYIIFNLSHKDIQAYKPAANKATQPADVQTQRGIIDSTKAVQYVPYKVLNSSRSGLLTANNYYTRSAKVVKDSTGFKVFLTVKETAGMVKFTPISINNGGFTNSSHSTTGGQDVWTYAFHIGSVTGLDRPIPAQIMMSVPIAGIANQHFNIWLTLGKTQTGGMDYLNSTSSAALPSSLALVNSSTANKTPTLLTNTPANRKKLAAANKNDANESASENNKLASVKQYPLIAEIAGFSAVALGIIGFAFYKKYRDKRDA